jgi:hypothetical protein
MNSYLRYPPDWEWIDPCGEPLGIRITAGIYDSLIKAPSRTILLYEGIPETALKYVVGGQAELLDHIDRCGNWTQVKGWFGKSAPKPTASAPAGRSTAASITTSTATATPPHSHRTNTPTPPPATAPTNGTS